MKTAIYKPDTIGAIASSLCLIHCIITPFIFIAQSCTATCCNNAPDWWIWLDYLFLTISFWAVYQSTQKTSKKFMKPLLWSLWIALCLAIINQRIQLIHVSQNLTHVFAISLAAFHLYNLKYCQCKTEQCCATND